MPSRPGASRHRQDVRWRRCRPPGLHGLAQGCHRNRRLLDEASAPFTHPDLDSVTGRFPEPLFVRCGTNPTWRGYGDHDGGEFGYLSISGQRN